MDQADLGELHAVTSIALSVPSLTNFGLCCAVSQIGVNTNGATFTFDDLVITGPPGTQGTPVNLSFNIALSGGGLSAVTTGQNIFAQSSFTVAYSLAGTSGQGSLSAGNGGAFDANGILQGVVTGAGAISNTIFTTADATVTVGTPFSFSLGVQALAEAGPTNFCNGGCVGTAAVTADFANTIGLPTTGSVANLPQGYTLDSSSGLIVNNQFIGGGPAATPEPPALIMLGSGLLSLALFLRRR
jgi:hypothetical protein